MKSILGALLSGLLLWLAWPTYGFAGLLFIAFVPLLLSEKRLRDDVKKKTAWRVLAHAYLTFLIWNFATTSWLYYATPFGMWFAVLVNSLLMATVFMVYHLFARKVNQGTAWTFLICLWMAFEYLHLHWDFSWPWLNLGNGFSEYTSWIQWYEYTGTFGGTLWVWLVNIAVTYLVFTRLKNVKSNQDGGRFAFAKAKYLKQIGLIATMVLLPIVVSVYIQSTYTVSITAESEMDEVLIVQPNIDPYKEKYFQTNGKVIELMEELITPEMNDEVDFIITPETVLADNRFRLPQVQYHRDIQSLRTLLAPYPNTYYLGGISMIDVFRKDDPRHSNQSNTLDGKAYFNDYNSAMFMNRSGQVDLYHKSKLVVGIENMPYKSVLEPLLGNVMIDLGGTVATKTTQEERSVFTTSDEKAIAPIICYESVYGDYVTDYVNNGAQYLAIITNDAWWANTQGHQQHLSLARLRAIENRRWIARSANTGISAIMDHTGAVRQSLGYEKRGVVSGQIQSRDELTFYTLHGDYLARIAMFIGVFTLLFGTMRSSGKRRGRRPKL